MSRRRWWNSGVCSIEAEQQWFVDEGLEFVLDEQLLRDKEVVAFRGDLRLDSERCAASVIYPPSYGVGGHPIVVAPDLPVQRHITPDGVVCLDHPVFGETAPMYGAEAASRAQHLWDLWVNDRDQLHEEEADTPDPHANYYEYCGDTGVVLMDVDVSGATRGYFRADATQFHPFRAGVVRVRTAEPTALSAEPGPAMDSFVGPLEVNGQWTRVDEAPPHTVAEFGAWLQDHHTDFVSQHVAFTKATAAWTKVPQLPTVARVPQLAGTRG